MTGLGVDAVETGKSERLELRFPNEQLGGLPAGLPAMQTPERVTQGSEEISQEGRSARFEIWEKLGVDRVRADLMNGGHQIVGGPSQVLDLVWEWVRMKDAVQRSQGVQLRRDPELIQQLLLKLESYPSAPGDVFLFNGSEPELAVDGYSAEQIAYHLEQLKELGLIDSPGSQPALGVTFRGLSTHGHDVLDRHRMANTPKAAAQRNTRPSRMVFIVHGHEGELREAVAGFLRKIDFAPIILHEQTNRGRTIVEKFEDHSEVDFAVVLLTPDDVGGPKGGAQQSRARQNVILELGYFIGKLGREKVCAIKQGDL